MNNNQIQDSSTVYAVSDMNNYNGYHQNEGLLPHPPPGNY